jgi:hypothetical protein
VEGTRTPAGTKPTDYPAQLAYLLRKIVLRKVDFVRQTVKAKKKCSLKAKLKKEEGRAKKSHCAF